jgi:hypothetical protein
VTEPWQVNRWLRFHGIDAWTDIGERLAPYLDEARYPF